MKDLCPSNDEAVVLLTVPGTGGWHNDKTRSDWWKPGSPFLNQAVANGFVVMDPGDPYVWTTDLNGMQFWRRWAVWKKKNRQPSDHGDWIAGGAAARFYEEAKRHRHQPAVVDHQGRVGFQERPRRKALVMWAHSFGGCVGFYAAEQGLEIDVLVTVGMPVRKDMRFVYEGARKHIGSWFHFQSSTGDRTAAAGMFGDGRFGNDRSYFPTEPDRLFVEPDVGHSRILHERHYLWLDNGWLDTIRQCAINNACRRLTSVESQS